MIEFKDFIQWCFYGLLSGIAIYLSTILNAMKASIDTLNINMATVIEKTSNHERRIEKIETKLEN